MNVEQIFEKYWQFAQNAFDTSASDSIFGLIRECRELHEAIQYNIGKKSELEEMADVQFYLLYTLFKQGYSIEEFIESMEIKLDIIKKRKWKKNHDNTYSHI